MDIIIGSIQAPTWRNTVAPPAGSTQVEAKLLAVRAPRQKRQGTTPGGQRRQSQNPKDPLNAQVLILMVPDKRALPRNLDSGHWRVVLQFVPQTRD